MTRARYVESSAPAARLDVTPVPETAVTVGDVVKTYPAPEGGFFNAVAGVSFEVRRGEVFGFLGPNGAGKTTTLATIEDPNLAVDTRVGPACWDLTER